MRRQFTYLALALLLFCSATNVFGQDATPAPEGDDAAAAGGEEGGEDAAEECEEAWEYVEFLKKELKEKIESILQETLFRPSSILEDTVSKTMEQVLEMRDAILTRTKALRNDEITICPEQNIKQEEFLTQQRMQIMSVLLSLIEQSAATPAALQEIGKQLLAIRTKVNMEITEMIMLRETKSIVRSGPKDDCDCGILDTVVEELDKVISSTEEDKDKDNEVDDGAEGDEATEEGAEPKEAGGAEEGGDNAQALIMTLMTIDGEIRRIYNVILTELDEEARNNQYKELQNLKELSNSLHEVLSELTELDPETEKDGIERLLRRDVRSVRNDAKRLLDDCQRNCPSECDSCGADKIDEVKDKLTDYKASLEDLEEEDAKDSIRTDLMNYLTQTNADMTELLKEKAEKGELDQCGTETLEVIDKIKGPLWMMVNITIFGDAATMTEMVNALEQALIEMRGQYCSPDDTVLPEPKIENDECDVNEINTAREYITDIDVIISEDLFKADTEDARRKAMLGLIDMKSTMEDRVRELFQDNLQCKEEVEQIKNIYTSKITECLAQMMNPRINYGTLSRAERVQCVKDLRIAIEERRGELLMREIEARINEATSGVQSEDGPETEAPTA